MQALADVVFQWSKSLARYAHAMSDTCRTWVILRANDRHHLHEPYKPWQIVPPITNVDVTLPMHTHN